MKYICIFLFALIISAEVQASAVSQVAAQNIAVNFFKLQFPAAASSGLTANLQYTRTEPNGQVDFYVFDISPAPGFVIVSADNNCMPVIAYSSEGPFNSHMSMTGLADWMNSAAKKINYAVVNGKSADARITNEWTSYTAGVKPSNYKNAGVTIGPLLSTTWNQEPFYNSLCPYDSADNARCVTGCVATAMAQIMKFWNYPPQGVGSFSYPDNNFGTLSASFTSPFNWAAMPANVGSYTSPVDTLMYLCGVSVAMNYGDDNHGGSGAFVLQSDIGAGNPCAQNSFVSYFKYNPNTIQGVYMNSYSTQAWISLLESELNAGRVIEYEGQDPSAGGHTWVCDGYDANDLLHMNWGWGGAADGFFSVNDLSAGGYNFDQRDGALIGIEPILPVSLSLSVTSPSICSGQAAVLNAQGPASATYTWTPASGLSCTNCPSPIANPSASTLYTVTVDSAGVTSSLSTAILIRPFVSGGFTFNASPSCTMPENVVFSNTSANATSFEWDFGDGAVSTEANPVHSYSQNGSYTVRMISSNSCGTDTTVMNQAVQILGGPPMVPCQNICAGEAVNLTTNSPGSISWYDGPSQADIMSNGNSYMTPPLSTTITYYIGSTIAPPVSLAGPADNSFAPGGFTTPGGLIFNSSVAQTLISVAVYAASSGNESFSIQDHTGAVISNTSVSLVQGYQVVPVNLSVPAGNNLSLIATGTNLYDNYVGATYPYNSSDGTVTITGDIEGATYQYDGFYDWQLVQNSCNTGLTPVTVYVLGTGGGAIIASGSGSPTVHYAPADTNAATYFWNFGDGATSSEEYPTHTYASGGNYSVQLIVSNDTCSDTTTQTISTLQLGVENLNAQSSFTVYPNPANDILNIRLRNAAVSGDMQISMENVLGQTVYSGILTVSGGSQSSGIDISTLEPGIYFIRLQNGVSKATAKFIRD